MLKTIALVAAGGATGAVARYLVVTMSATLWGSPFPVGTIVVNIAGSCILGLLMGGVFSTLGSSSELRTLLVIGFLGSFTTFSAFSGDTVSLIERNAYLAAGTYIAVSVIGSIVAFLIGLRTIKALVA